PTMASYVPVSERYCSLGIILAQLRVQIFSHQHENLFMRTFRCLCKNMLFFDNSFCLQCGREVGHCPVCRLIVPLLQTTESNLRCGNPTCEALLVKCHNYVTYDVCNRCIESGRQNAVEENVASTAPLCECCRFTRTIPDLSVPGNLEKWYRLEMAKRR